MSDAQVPSDEQLRNLTIGVNGKERFGFNNAEFVVNDQGRLVIMRELKIVAVFSHWDYVVENLDDQR